MRAWKNIRNTPMNVHIALIYSEHDDAICGDMRVFAKYSKSDPEFSPTIFATLTTHVFNRVNKNRMMI